NIGYQKVGYEIVGYGIEERGKAQPPPVLEKQVGIKSIHPESALVVMTKGKAGEYFVQRCNAVQSGIFNMPVRFWQVARERVGTHIGSPCFQQRYLVRIFIGISCNKRRDQYILGITAVSKVIPVRTLYLAVRIFNAQSFRHDQPVVLEFLESFTDE